MSPIIRKKNKKAGTGPLESNQTQDPQPHKVGRVSQKMNPRALGTNPRAQRLKTNLEWAQKVVDKLVQSAAAAEVDLKIRDSVLYATKVGSKLSARWDIMRLDAAHRPDVLKTLQKLGIK